MFSHIAWSALSLQEVGGCLHYNDAPPPPQGLFWSASSALPSLSLSLSLSFSLHTVSLSLPPVSLLAALYSGEEWGMRKEERGITYDRGQKWRGEWRITRVPLSMYGPSPWANGNDMSLNDWCSSWLSLLLTVLQLAVCSMYSIVVHLCVACIL